jgi:hypothetical protein
MSRSAPVALFAVFCGILVSRNLHFQKLTWFVWVLFVSGTSLNALMRPESNAGILYVLRITPAVGAGFLFQLPLYAVQANSKVISNSKQRFKAERDGENREVV